MTGTLIVAAAIAASEASGGAMARRLVHSVPLPEKDTDILPLGRSEP
ncbi:hypothetical protein [Mesorhizobium sp. Z1-4]|nr:hypothetical protein [Mesorhizobium sp. Z1-4]